MARIRSRLMLVAGGAAVAIGAALAGRGSCADESRDAGTPGARSSIATANYSSDGPRYIGAAGCAAAMCHGGGGLADGERSPVGSEYTYWLARDPHAQAFAVLLQPESTQIIERLRAAPPYADLPAAHEARVCLTCHSISPGARAGEPEPHGLQGGVSCEACHGAAEHWLGPHKRADWQDLSPAAKQALGFRNTEDLLVRARVCGECHVGASAGRDVNHDLIAAGHPRLNFEFAAYQTNLPAHWDTAAEHRAALGEEPRRTGLLTRPARVGRPVLRENHMLRESDLRRAYEAKLWAVGQVGAARQALELLRLRAAGESAQSVWPELSEYDCFACHHHLEAGTHAGSWRQARGFGGRRPGGLAWGTWAYPLLPLLAAETGGPDLTGADSVFRQLERELTRPYPDRKEVRRLASEVASELDAWAADLNGRNDWSQDAGRWLRRLTDEGAWLARRDWDGAAQTYLALAALAEAAPDAQAGGGARPILERGLETIREALRFGTGEEPGAPHSPRNYADRLQTILDELSRIQSELNGR